LTLPNILKVFNPYLTGFSVGVLKSNPIFTRKAKAIGPNGKFHYNFADTGADSDDVIKQAYRLVRRMKADPHVDYYKDWKLVTLLVGHNDICSHSCKRTDFFSPVKNASPWAYINNIKLALDHLHKHLPRTFVNLMAVSDISKMFDIKRKPLPCVFTHSYGCPCLFDRKFSRPLKRRQVKALLNAYLKELKKLVGSGRYDTREDFTVVLQPTLIDADLPRIRGSIDVSFLAPDCFHFAQKTHAIGEPSVH